MEQGLIPNILLVLEILVIPIIVIVVISYAKIISLEAENRNLKDRHENDIKNLYDTIRSGESAYSKLDHKVDELKEDMAVIKALLERKERKDA